MNFPQFYVLIQVQNYVISSALAQRQLSMSKALKFNKIWSASDSVWHYGIHLLLALLTVFPGIALLEIHAENLTRYCMNPLDTELIILWLLTQVGEWLHLKFSQKKNKQAHRHTHRHLGPKIKVPNSPLNCKEADHSTFEQTRERFIPQSITTAQAGTLCTASHGIPLIISNSKDWSKTFIDYYNCATKSVSQKDWLCWGLTTHQPLRVILCRLPEKGRKEIRRESRGDEREGQGRKRNRNESEETEEIKTFPLYPYPLQG